MFTTTLEQPLQRDKRMILFECPDKNDECWKLKKLLRFMKEERYDQMMIVFVKRRVTANQLAYLIENEKHKGLSFGWHDEAETQKQLEVLTNFVSKQFKVLVATATVEEGVDVSEVDTVIADDSILNFKSFVQAKGRCRKETQGRKSIFLMTTRRKKSRLELLNGWKNRCYQERFSGPQATT